MPDPFEYEVVSRPEVVDSFNKAASTAEYWKLIESLLDNGGLKGPEEHEAVLSKLQQFKHFLTPDQCWSIASIAHIKSDLSSLAYELGFKKSEKSVI